MSETSDPAAEAASDYEAATTRLDQIIARLDSGDAQLRETLDLCSEAKGLIEYCATELAAVDQGLKELRLEDLAVSLKPTGASDSTVPARSDELPPPPEEPPAPPEEPPF